MNWCRLGGLQFFSPVTEKDRGNIPSGDWLSCNLTKHTTGYKQQQSNPLQIMSSESGSDVDAADTKHESPTKTAASKERPSKSVFMPLFMITIVLIGLVMAIGFQNPKFKAAVVDFFPEEVIFAIEDNTGLSLSSRGFKRDLSTTHTQDELPSRPVAFSVHFNGDGLSKGTPEVSSNYKGLDEFIRRACVRLTEVQEIAKDDPVTLETICDPEQGARLFTDTGVRAMSFFDILPNQRTYIVPQGLQYVWATGKVGTVIEHGAIESPVPGKPIRLRQLSLSPRVFTIENFMSPVEMKAILDHNRDLVKPSEVGFAGWRDSTRTSSTSWDQTSWAAKKIQRRSFDLVGMDFDAEMADAPQILRYNVSEWYKPHNDWFDSGAYDGHDPQVDNGTNRFATVFLYLTDVEAGGHTVFPLSTTHEGYNGEEIVAPGTVKTPGYIAQKDAEWACNSSSSALRSTPVAGNAVLFYSQGADGKLDPYSLHGGCPPIKGIKWSANGKC
mmetsp:Transcript_35401/g.56583  ORF Transcript_35401/g.56583 Transcript_35401/m.56583 type:complete len:498 (-) Transcript_35401:449-1942(-)